MSRSLAKSYKYCGTWKVVSVMNGTLGIATKTLAKNFKELEIQKSLKTNEGNGTLPKIWRDFISLWSSMISPGNQWYSWKSPKDSCRKIGGSSDLKKYLNSSNFSTHRSIWIIEMLLQIWGGGDIFSLSLQK